VSRPAPRTTPRKTVIIPCDFENALECTDDRSELDVDFTLGLVVHSRLGQPGAGHAARHLIEIGEEPPDLGARKGNRKRLPQLDAVPLHRTPFDRFEILRRDDLG
jgi:hypothetical protein